MTAKIGTLDIETSPIKAGVWSLWKQNVGLNQIDTEWSILSFCFKPLGGSVEYRDCRGQKDVRDDSGLLHRLWEILNEYDFIVAQNGVRFDMKKIRARMVMHGMPPFSPVRVIDTMLIAKREFGFTSNRLEWMSTHLTKTKKRKHKRFPGFDLWTACLEDRAEAWEEMRLYNVDDVKATEELYKRLRPWAGDHPNVATHAAHDTTSCPHCGSGKLRRDGVYYTDSGMYDRYQCDGCGAWARSRYTKNSTSKRKSILKAI